MRGSDGVTGWIERSGNGDLPSPEGLARAWVGLITRPRQFFREDVEPDRHLPALAFAMLVVAISETLRLALVPDAHPVFGGLAVPSALLWLVAVVLVVTPIVLALVTAVQTLLVKAFVDDPGDPTETAQIVAYATAPCVLAGVPIPEVTALVVIWGTVLLAIGVSEVHGPWFEPALALSAIPSAIVFGFGFRGIGAVETLLRQWYII